MATRVVFVGAGHAHLYALKRTRELSARGIEVILVSPEPFWYSGLATGVLGGRYPASLDRIDIAERVRAAGGRTYEDHVVRIDPSNRTLRLSGGTSVPYDALSLNIGSRTRSSDVPGMAEFALPVKPVRNLLRLKDRLESANAGRTVRVAVAGAGPAGCEVAANLHALGRASGLALDVTLLSRGGRILASMPEGAADAAWRHLSERGVRIVTGTTVTKVERGALTTANGERLPFEHLVNATGLEPHALIRESGLPVDGAGALEVTEHLHSKADPRVFGGGECVSLLGRMLPKVGIYAIRQAPVLYGNILASLEGRPLSTFVPQKKFLLILNLGDGAGLAVRGRRWWYGRLAFRLKDWIDRRFLREYAD